MEVCEGGEQARLPVRGPWSGGGLDLGGILLRTAVLLLEVSLQCGLCGGVMHWKEINRPSRSQQQHRVTCPRVLPGTTAISGL